jgi:hypothetical protein
MTDRETRIRATVLQLSRMVAALEDSHRTVLPKNPRQFALESECDIDMISRLCAELRELVGVEFPPNAVPKAEPSPAPVVPLTGADVSSSIAAKQ